LQDGENVPLAEYVPAVHGDPIEIQLELPPVEVIPIPQNKHAVAPVDALNEPTEQSEHTDAPAAAEYFPGTQLKHEEEPLTKDENPTGQLTHTDEGAAA